MMRLRHLALSLFLALLPVPLHPASDAVAAELDRSQVEQIIHDYLLAHPEVIRDAVEALSRREEEEKQKASVAAVSSNKDLLLASPHQAVIGNPKGDVTLVEFFDYNCPYCRKSAADVATLLEKNPGLRIVLKDWPILGQESVEAAQVAIAARMQDGGPRFQSFHEKLLAAQGRVGKAAALEVAEAVGYDVKKIEADLASDEIKTNIDEVGNLATALGITGTPTFVAGKSAVAGAIGVEALQNMLGKALTECKGQIC
jgi:protein-disulfide isomerase